MGIMDSILKAAATFSGANVATQAQTPKVASSSPMGANSSRMTTSGDVMKSASAQRWNPDAPAADRLAHFGSNKTAAQDEIAQVKSIYESEKAKGASADRLNQISSWADQVRNASGISTSDPLYGNNNGVSSSTQAALTNSLTNQQSNNSNNAYDNAVAKSQQNIDRYQRALANARDAASAAAIAEQMRREQQRLKLISGMQSEAAASKKAVQAQLDSAKSASLAEIKKAYDDAVVQGDMSVREAEEAYAQQVKEIDANAYQSAQTRNLAAAQRGIGNSQQYLGMVETDTAQTEGYRASSASGRDKTVLDIRDRIKALANTKDTETQRINEQYNSNLIAAQSQIDSQLRSSINKLNVDDYNATNAFKQQMAMLQSSQDFSGLQADKAQMDAIVQLMMQGDVQSQQQAQAMLNDIAKMGMANDFQIEQMAKQTENQKDLMGIAQQYDLDKMAQQAGYQDARDAKLHGYDVEKMATQFGYQSALQAQQDSAAMARQKSGEAASARSQGNALQQLYAKYQLEAQAADAEYQKMAERELSKYTPGTKEYQIRQGQLADAQAQKTQDIRDKFITESQIKNTVENPYLSQALDAEASGTLTPPGNDFWSHFTRELNPWSPTYGDLMGEYNKKIDAINKYNQLMGQ